MKAPASRPPRRVLDTPYQKPVFKYQKVGDVGDLHVTQFTPEHLDLFEKIKNIEFADDVSSEDIFKQACPDDFDKIKEQAHQLACLCASRGEVQLVVALSEFYKHDRSLATRYTVYLMCIHAEHVEELCKELFKRSSDGTLKALIFATAHTELLVYLYSFVELPGYKNYLPLLYYTFSVHGVFHLWMAILHTTLYLSYKLFNPSLDASVRMIYATGEVSLFRCTSDAWFIRIFTYHPHAYDLYFKYYVYKYHQGRITVSPRETSQHKTSSYCIAHFHDEQVRRGRSKVTLDNFCLSDICPAEWYDVISCCNEIGKTRCIPEQLIANWVTEYSKTYPRSITNTTIMMACFINSPYYVFKVAMRYIPHFHDLTFVLSVLRELDNKNAKSTLKMALASLTKQEIDALPIDMYKLQEYQMLFPVRRAESESNKKNAMFYAVCEDCNHEIELHKYMGKCEFIHNLRYYYNDQSLLC